MTFIARSVPGRFSNAREEEEEVVVQLRGELERPELIDQLVERVRSVQGVRDVENLLHLPGTPAPTHE